MHHTPETGRAAPSRQNQPVLRGVQLRLFDRNRNVVAITAAGREFVRHANIVLRKEAELMEMVSHAARGDGGSIALGMAPLASRTLLSPLDAEMIDKPGFHATHSSGSTETEESGVSRAFRHDKLNHHI